MGMKYFPFCKNFLVPQPMKLQDCFKFYPLLYDIQLCNFTACLNNN